MLREEYLRRLVDDAYIDLYLAGCEGARIYWPWRMAREGGSYGTRYRNACESYWLDSSIFNSEYKNKDVLDDGFKVDAEAVLLADTMGDYEQTVDSIHEGLALADDHSFEGTVIIPLQEPYDECYKEFEGESTHYAIGGLNRGSDRRRIEAARTVRNMAGNSIHLHGLGWGIGNELAGEIHANPELLDSVDYSTPIQSNTDALAGKERMSVLAMKAATQLVEDLRKVTPNVEIESKNQSGMEAYL